MNIRSLGALLRVLIGLGFSLILGAGAVYADDDDNDKRMFNHKVTIENLTGGQPFSPPVAASHRGDSRMFKVGKLASSELEAIAEDGNQSPMVELFSGLKNVTDVQDVGRPITPLGTAAMGFTDSASFEIQSHAGDKFSLATMLICTNDGITGLDRVKLPNKGARVRLLNGYDAGTEQNTELSEHVVDPCTGLGVISLAGDPNGNENEAVDTEPHVPIGLHPNITGAGDLAVDIHGWVDPVARVTITRIADDANEFQADLSGVSEVPMVPSVASGRAKFDLNDSETALDFTLNVRFLTGVTQAHIHIGPPNENGSVVAFLFGLTDPGGSVDGRLAAGTLTAADLVGPLTGDFAGLVEMLRTGEAYVNVHTSAHPGGEIRGQIGVR